ncbi:hypothetical protein Q4505_17775, partial [Pacificibacter sp. 1_MG-2023]|nr:hypothetical protein [Pacificibacter sp. 1_MG-2023]
MGTRSRKSFSTEFARRIDRRERPNADIGHPINMLLSQLAFQTFAAWSCLVYVPVSELIYAAFRSKAKGLL